MDEAVEDGISSGGVDGKDAIPFRHRQLADNHR